MVDGVDGGCVGKLLEKLLAFREAQAPELNQHQLSIRFDSIRFVIGCEKKNLPPGI
jgi:hypothetical protein